MIFQEELGGKMKFAIISICIFTILLQTSGKVLEEEQRAVVNELREKLTEQAKADNNDYLDNWITKTPDGVFDNWLIYTDNDVDKALKLLPEYTKWREENKLDDAKNWDFSEEDNAVMPWALIGHTDDGNSVIDFPIGKWDVRGLLASGMKLSKILRQTVRAWEVGMSTPDPKTGKYPDNFINLVDFEGFSLAQVTSIRAMSYVLNVANTYVTKFPFVAKRAIMFQDPPYFQVFWNAIKGVVPAKFLEYGELYGQDEEKWREAIKNELPDRLIPEYLGIGGEAKPNYVTNSVDN